MATSTIKVDEAQYANPSTGWTQIYQNYTKAKRRGKAVAVIGESGSGGIALTAGAYKDITTLPADFRPSQSIYFTPATMGGDAHLTGMITSAGVVKIYSDKATSYWAFSVTYLID